MRTSSAAALVGTLAAAAVLFLAPHAAHATTNTVIGLLLPPEEPEATDIRDGALFAVEQANPPGSNQVRLIVRGRIGQWGADGVEAGRMVIEDGVAAMIAPPSGAATHLALQVAGRTAVPVVSLCPDSSISQAGVPWMARIAPGTVQEAEALFRGLSHGPAGPRRWAAVVPAGRAGREIARDLRTAAAETDCSLEGIVELRAPFTNFPAVCSEISSRHPDVVLAWLDPGPAAEFVKSLRQTGFSGVLAGPGALGFDEFTRNAGKSSEGLVVPAIDCNPASTAGLHSFNEAWRKRFGREPRPIGRYSYDAALLLLKLLQETGAEPLHRSFPLHMTAAGVSGELKFDEQGNRIVSLQLLTAREGKFVSFAR